MRIRGGFVWTILHIGIHLLVRVEAIPTCFTQAASKEGIICKDEDLQKVDKNIYSQLSAGALTLTKTKIASVQLTNCTISNLDFLDSDYLQAATELTLDQLHGISANHLKSLIPHMSPTLKRLTIINNKGLTSVDDLISSSVASSWESLETFRVKNNGLESVSANLFRRINSPTEYDFRRNSLQVLDLRNHNSVSGVRKILVGDNRLTSISGLEAFKSLERLDLASNQLTNVDSFISNVLKSDKLSSLDLSNNRISSLSLSGRAPTTITGTLEMHLQKNKLTSIPKFGSGIMKNVRKLNLGDNINLKFTEDTFKDLGNLDTLRLYNCDITQITRHIQGLPKLRTLDLRQNKINELLNDAFRGTTNVEEIQLQDNMLQKLDFMTSSNIILKKLKKLDVSRNRLSDLKKFVSAPVLEELRIDGAADKNELNELSTCGTFRELPSTLKIVCARGIESTSVNGCKFRSFLDLLRTQKVIYNNECCNKPSCNVNNGVSNYPAKKECPSKEAVCNPQILKPDGTTTVKPNPGVTRPNCERKGRASFEGLHDTEKIVIAIGYILALIFLVMVLILFLRRYRSYDKWLDDHHQRDATLQTRHSTDTLDTIDGKLAGGSPRLNGTLQRQRVNACKSFDNISMASGISGYSTATGKSPFMGRKKFKDANSIDMEEQSIRYTPASQRPRLESGEESPTAMSVYSYASHQPERRQGSESATPPTERKRHRSGGAVQRLKSSDKLAELMKVDDDILPPQVQVVLQRKATEKRNQAGSSPIARNSRPYNTAPYRTKGKSGIVKKRLHSPMLMVTNRVHRRSGIPTPPMIKRALPDLPLDSMGLVSSSMRSASSFASNNSKLSSSSQIKNNVFAMDADETVYHETDHLETNPLDVAGLG